LVSMTSRLRCQFCCCLAFFFNLLFHQSNNI
jgi:hypothetical protein